MEMTGTTVADNSIKPNEDISPQISITEAVSLARELYGINVIDIRQLNGYDDKNYHVKIADEHENVHLGEICQYGYVLKIINSEDSKWPQAEDMHVKAMFCLSESGITAPRPVRNLQGDYFCQAELYQRDNDGNQLLDQPRRHLVRLSTYIPGQILYEHPNPSLTLFYRVGKLVANVISALKKVEDHPVFSAPGFGTLWMMNNHHRLKDFIYATRDPKRRELLTDVTNVFEEKVLKKSHLLTQGVIHDDINEQNVLIRKRLLGSDQDEPYDICGLLDFSDINKSCTIFDVAISMMYMMTVDKDDQFLKIGGAVLRGFRDHAPVSALDLEVLPYAVAMRYAVSLGMGEHGVMLNPDNLYKLTTAERGWEQLEKLWSMPMSELRTEWGIC